MTLLSIFNFQFSTHGLQTPQILADFTSFLHPSPAPPNTSEAPPKAQSDSLTIKVPATSAEVPPTDDKASFEDQRSASPPASAPSYRACSSGRDISGKCSSARRTCNGPTSCEHTPARLGSPHKASGSLPSSGNRGGLSAPPSSFHFQCVT